MYCKNCGQAIELNKSFCTACGTKVEKTDHSIVTLSHNEQEIKTYHVTTLDRKTNGYITVTNKRVIYHAYGKKSKTLSEVQMDKIGGVSTYFGKGFHIIMTIIAIIVFLLALGMSNATDGGSVFFGGLIAAIILYFAYQHTYYIGIFADGTTTSPISVGSKAGSRKLTSQGAAIVVNGRVTKEGLSMMTEIGAIILDFKNLGDHAIERWVKSPVNEIVEDDQKEDVSTSQSTNIFA